MELKLNNKQLERIFTTAKQLNIEEESDTSISYNGLIINYDDRQSMLDDLKTIDDYINTLNGAIFY